MVTLEDFLLSSHDRTRITAQLTHAVYVGPSGKYLLIRQGAKLIGKDDSSVAFGQSRILLGYPRRQPGGNSIVLERQPGACGSSR